jgi:hypothetical protein
VEFRIAGNPTPITNVAFSVFDLDTGNTSNPTTYRDQVRNVRGTALNSSTFGATLASPTGTHSISNNGTTTATATAVASSGTLSDDNPLGTVNVSYGSNVGWSYQFT